MPRFRYRGPKPPKPPKPPKAPKPMRPKTKDLRMICKGLVTTDIGQRINSLLYILKWYDDAIIYLTFKQTGALTPEQRKSMDRVHKSRLQGQGTTFNDEKETAYKTAIRILEKLMDKLLQPPRIDSFYAILDKKKPKLEQKAENWMAKYGQTIQMFQKALEPVNAAGEKIEISIGPVQEEVQKDAELKRFVFRPDIAKQLHRKRQREGLLSAVMEPTVIEELARLSAMEKELDQNHTWTGRWLAPGLKQNAAITRMLRNLIAFAKLAEAPKRLVKAAVAEVINGQPKAPRAVRAGFGGFHKGPLVEGMFIENSTAHLLYEILKDGKSYQKKELRTKLGKDAINSSLAKLAGAVVAKGWKLDVNGNTVTMHTGGQP